MEKFARDCLIGTRVSKAEKELLESICKAKRITMADLLRKMIMIYLSTRKTGDEND